MLGRGPGVGREELVMGYRVAYFEVGSRDQEALVRFYRDLFGWQVEEGSQGYSMIDTRAGTGINGGIGRSRSGDPWVTFYVAVPDPQAILDQAASQGGSTVMPVTEIPGMVTFAMFND